MRLIVPLRIESQANIREHWAKTYARQKKQKKAVWAEFKKLNCEVKLPCLVRLTRIAPRSLDFDNLCAAMKTVTDAICDQILPGLRAGRADGDKRIKVDYAQEKGRPKQYMLKIEIFDA